jgi:hypothetical protein
MFNISKDNVVLLERATMVALVIACGIASFVLLAQHGVF